MSADAGTPIVFAAGTESCSGTVHLPPGGKLPAVGVLVCSPLGWEDMCAYRPLRGWAGRLAHDGFAVLRFDWPGTGDSGGTDSDPARFDAWCLAASDAAALMRERIGVERAVGLGVGVGGMILMAAIARGARIDDVVVWGTPSLGRQYLRAVRAFNLLEVPEFVVPEVDVPPLPEGAQEAGGFLIAADTAEALRGLDLAELPLPDASGRALVLGRDGLPPETGLAESLSRAGYEVAIGSAWGWGSMTSEPHGAAVPEDAVAHVERWLAEGPPVTRTGRLIELPSPHRALRVGNRELTEDTIAIAAGPRTLAGVLTRPARAVTAETAVVFLNAGAVRRTGPNRMWVRLSRELAAEGIPSLRLDLGGIGDGVGPEPPLGDVAVLYDIGVIGDVGVALRRVEAETGARRLVCVGLCSGAYWSFHAALRDPSVSGLCLLNPRLFFWDDQHASIREARTATESLRSRRAWNRLLRGQVHPRRVLSVLDVVVRGGVERLRGRTSASAPAADAPLDEAFSALRDRRTAMLLVFSEGEPLLEELRNAGRDGDLTRAPFRLRVVAGPGHTFRPLWSQDVVCDHVRDAIQSI